MAEKSQKDTKFPETSTSKQRKRKIKENSHFETEQGSYNRNENGRL